mmetsp:Transcript_26253/g.44793  ORF Transcript_26253/g.44793 Transcript_26253/m.44793 type:complete len:386 (+) Transcript_26253:158-1315(+)|eukprot:CAMPEP_0183727588 /NCGR_PEP_ID=MMETSP0737-20130205/25902_1 /TAXON_ID=385413 /ORGANISM="Thalassiosira miniscula, Strain CCMP1093" /LENGTH=385 /DNA_ID=CAMNT_0025959257 /DNA_START=115 /DNA_END=1272 /DNA_ORIENTATION=-
MEDKEPTLKGEGNLDRPKDNMPKPKRPLSSFNLFYRFKRQKVLDAIALGKSDRDDICRLIDAAPGLEHYPPRETEGDPSSDPVMNELRRKNIRKDLEHNLLPRNTRDRAHRTDESAMNGSMSFLELGKLMNASWKRCDDFAKSVFTALAEEGRAHYRKALKEYDASVKEFHKELNDKASLTKKSSKKKGGGKVSSVLSKKKDNKRKCMDAGSKSRSFDAASTTLTHKADKFASNQMSPRESKRSPQKKNSLATQEVNHPDNRPDNESAATLQARVKELEAQLVAEKLRSRIRELEGELARQQVMENQITAQREMLLRGGASATVNPPSMQGGLWPFMSSGMVHPSMQAPKRAPMPPGMTGASAMNNMMGYMNNLPPNKNKKQRFS